MGRPYGDRTDILGSGVDGSVTTLETAAFDDAGRLFRQTSINNNTHSDVNQTEYLYNGYGQLTTIYQSHSGDVNTSTTPKVVYTYSQPAGANYSRLTSMTYPNGRVLNYVYNSGIDSTISRVSALADAGGSLPGTDQAYTYLGLSTIVQKADGNGIDLTYIQQAGETNVITDGGDRYTGLDRFGRVDDQYWVNPSTPTSPTDRFQYGYDANYDVLYKHNLVNASFSELYHTNGSSNGYDNLNRLTNFQRGTLNGTNDSITGTPSATNNWNLDALGNWTGTGTQTRTFNAENQITGISGATTPTYDNNGNMTQDETGKKYVYDAWNRIVKVETSTGSVLATYSYDARGNRITQQPNGGFITDLYYAGNNVIEERFGGNVNAQYVWGLGYQNNLVLRDDNYASGSLGINTSGLGRRLYIQHDANWNATAAVDVSGNVVQRYAYDPYGSQTVLNSNWNAATDVASLLYGFQSGRRDATSGLIHFGTEHGRDYSPTLGRWAEQDTSYIGGANLYQGMDSSPLMYVDPLGTDAYVISIGIHSLIGVDVSDQNGDYAGTLIGDFGPSGGQGFWSGVGMTLGGVGGHVNLSFRSKDKGPPQGDSVYRIHHVNDNLADSRLRDWLLKSAGQGRNWLDRAVKNGGGSTTSSKVWKHYNWWGHSCVDYSMEGLNQWFGHRWHEWSENGPAITGDGLIVDLNDYLENEQ